MNNILYSLEKKRDSLISADRELRGYYSPYIKGQLDAIKFKLKWTINFIKIVQKIFYCMGFISQFITFKEVYNADSN